MATDGQLKPYEDWSPPDWFWQISASKFLDGAVKPWEWNEVSIEWLSRTLVVMDSYSHLREVKEKAHR